MKNRVTFLLLVCSKQSVEGTMPASLKLEYSNCRVIIDCTEIATEQPPALDQQVILY